MSTVTGITADAAQAILDGTIVSAAVNGSGHLILTKHDASTVDAGLVTGDDGPTGPTGPAGPTGVAPTGAVMMWAAAIAPTGWLLCNGAAINRTTFLNLFLAISTVYGAGNGTTTFNIPNFQGNFPRMDTANLAAVGGEANHSHGITDHTHHLDGGSTPAAAHILIQTGASPNIFMDRVSGIGNYTASHQAAVTSNAVSTSVESAGALVTGISSNAGLVTTQNFASLPPYQNINFIIKT